MTLYVEGGGNSSALRTACREGFNKFVTAAGVAKKPRVVACGSRRDAFESYCTAVQHGKPAMLLVDSEAPVATKYRRDENSSNWQPWHYLKNSPQDAWDKPSGVPDTDCHLMVQCMESWFLADSRTLAEFFGQGFKQNQLPSMANGIESIVKKAVLEALHRATKDCKTKASYGKGEHSFRLLGLINPALVAAASPWAHRFVDELKKKTR